MGSLYLLLHRALKPSFMACILFFTVNSAYGQSYQTYREAQLALLFVRASLDAGRAARADRYIILPGSAEVSEEEAINALAGMRKPLSCSLEALPHILAIRCVTITDPSVARIQEAARDHFVRGLDRDFAALGVSNPLLTKVLVEGAAEQLVVTSTELRGFASSYLIAHAIGMDPPTPDQAARGVGVVWKVSGGQDGWWAETPLGTMRPGRLPESP